jgi:hypothetical protein
MRIDQYCSNPLWLSQGQDLPLDGPGGRLPSRASLVWAMLMAESKTSSRQGSARTMLPPVNFVSGKPESRNRTV